MTVRRYMSFEKFVYLLKTGLLCPKSSLFEDQWEGLISLRNDWINEDWKSNFSIAREWIYVSCWHVGTDESYAMWKIYGEHPYSVCIETTEDKLVEIVKGYNSAPEFALGSGLDL